MKRVLVLLIAMYLQVGCYFISGPGIEPVLVESNKRQKPAWAAMAPEVFFYDGEDIGFVFNRKHLLFLESGLRQTEIIAKEACMRSIRQSYAKEASLAPDGRKSAASHKNSHDQINYLKSTMEVADIYYEALKPDTPGSSIEFEVMVLLKISKNAGFEFPKAIDALNR